MRAHYVVLAAAALSVVSACNSSGPPPAAVKTEAAATQAPPPKPRATACELVTGAEMSAILGGKVVPRNNDHSNGKTECVYTAAEGVSPYAELSVEWGPTETA